MPNRRQVLWRVGFFAALALAACLTTALAAAGQVSYNFANVSMDGQREITAGQDITAANGQKIPGSILYTDEAGGKTNYVSGRQFSELIDADISWDANRFLAPLDKDMMVRMAESVTGK